MEVQAQVMTRDDSTQCWVPMGGGGLSTVKLCKLPRLASTSVVGSGDSKPPEYVIHGERIADKSVSTAGKHCWAHENNFPIQGDYDSGLRMRVIKVYCLWFVR